MRSSATARAVLFLGALSIVGVACGGGGGGGTGGGGTGGGGTGNTGGSSSALYEPCSDADRLGGFSAKLLADSQTTAVAGGVRNAVRATDVWQQVATGGECRLVVGPTLTCAPACANPLICAGQNQCVDEPRFQDVGAVTVTGVGASTVTAALITGNNYYASVDTPYPPAAAGANIGLQVAGGSLGGFSLMGRGISELQVPSTPLTVMGGQAFSFSWTAPAQPGAARISASLDIAHHGGVFARVDCDFADDGSGEIPATLIDQLIGYGTAGFPELILIRRTVDSTSIASGCVDFQVASERLILLELCRSPGVCVRSCSPDLPCPNNAVCKADRTCP
jgi:hypothetical protein